MADPDFKPVVSTSEEYSCTDDRRGDLPPLDIGTGATEKNTSFDSWTLDSPVPRKDDDPLLVRRIAINATADDLDGLTQVAHSQFGPVWDAMYGRTPVRVFGVRCDGDGDGDGGGDETARAAFRRSLEDVLRRQVRRVGHPSLARLIALVDDLPCVDDPLCAWTGIVFRSPRVSLRAAAACAAVYDGSRFLEAIPVDNMALGPVHPSFFLNGGTEMACWGLAGAVNNLWISPSRLRCVAPELRGVTAHGEAAQRWPESALVYTIGRIAADSPAGSIPPWHGEYMTALLGAALDRDPAARPGLRVLMYGLQAEAAFGGMGWSWVHYACVVDDRETLAGHTCVSVVGDHTRCDLAKPVLQSDMTPLAVACLHRSADCVSFLLEQGFQADAETMRCAVQGGCYDAIAALIAAGVSVRAEHVARANNPRLFAALLAEFAGNPGAVLINCYRQDNMNPACLACLARCDGFDLKAAADTLFDTRSGAPDPGVIEEAVRLAQVALLAASDDRPDGAYGDSSGGGLTRSAPGLRGGTTKSSGSETQSGSADFGGTPGLGEGAMAAPAWVEIYPHDLFTRSRRIGKGSFGEVYKAELYGTQVAVKRIKVTRPGDGDNFLAEVAVHAWIRHPHVLLMIGVMRNKTLGTYGIVSELMAGGDLATKVRGARQGAGGAGFPDWQRARVLRQAAEGIAFLHENDLIHRDIKPANILLTGSGDAKVGDLGLTSVQGGREGKTRKYAAPEILCKEAAGPGGGSTTFSDAYAFALTAYEVLTLARLPHDRQRAGKERCPPWEIDDELPVPPEGAWWSEVALAVLTVESPDQRPDGMEEWIQRFAAIEELGDARCGAFAGLCVAELWDDAVDAAELGVGGALLGPRTTALHIGASRGAPRRVLEAAVGLHCGFDALDSRGRTPLMVAATGEVVADLVYLGAPLDAAAGDGMTALLGAAAAGRDTIVAALIAAGADATSRDRTDRREWNAVQHAAACGHRRTVAAVLEGQGAAQVVDEVGRDGNTALMLAARGNHVKAVFELVDQGKADVNVAGAKGLTPLMCAAKAGHSGCLDALVSLLDADLAARNTNGWTALIYAVEHGHVQAVKMLAEAGGGTVVNAADYGGLTPLMRAARVGHSAVVETLVKAGALIDARDSLPPAQDTDMYRRQWTALMYAAEKGHGDVVRLLLAAGADRDLAATDGRTAADIALQWGHDRVVAVLLDQA